MLRYGQAAGRRGLRPCEQIDLLSRRRVLDGGFASELEARGIDVSGPLWSAAAIANAPEMVQAVHRSYLKAGADILLTASYQVSAMGFAFAGLAGTAAEAAAMEAGALRRAVGLAAVARTEAQRPEVLLAASLGPYGAALANGAEFTGDYGFASEYEEFRALVRFHEPRIAALAETEADLLAFETLPSLQEARAIVAALRLFPAIGAWLSFTCRDDGHVAHGEPLGEIARLLDREPQVLAVGVNCIAPTLVLPLLGELRAATGKPLVVYPNSGEGWDAGRRCWLPAAEQAPFSELVRSWFAAGAQIVGGCCRIGPREVRTVRAAADAF